MHTYLATENDVTAMFKLAGFKVKSVIELPNRYWPRVEAYFKLRNEMPWWLVSTEFGNIIIGPRKRVVSISWEDTNHEVILTTDETTKENFLVHAWTTVKCLEYLILLRQSLENAPKAFKTKREELEARGITNIIDCPQCRGLGYEYS